MNSLTESSIDKSLLYFHGSANGKITKMNPPTASRPLFVTADIDYANEYLKAAHVNGRAKFEESEDDPGKVYVLTLFPENIDLFDPENEADRKRLENAWPDYILDQLDKYSVWSIFKYLTPRLEELYGGKYNGDLKKYLKDIDKAEYFEDEMGKASFKEGLETIVENYEDALETIFLKEKQSGDAALFAMIALFNDTLLENGFNAFKNKEQVKDKSSGKNVKTDKAIGLLTVDTVDYLSPVPLDQDIVKQAIEELDDDGKQSKRNYENSNEKIKELITAYKAIV